ncbi:hypothetical protein AHAS_Ahas16G0085700 [Arachis hypogaea]
MGINVNLVFRCVYFIPCYIIWMADNEAYLTREWSAFVQILNAQFDDIILVGCR